MNAGKGNRERAQRPVVAVDPMANGFAGAIEAMGGRVVALPQDGYRLDPLSVVACGTALVPPGRLLLGRPGHGKSAGGER